MSKTKEFVLTCGPAFSPDNAKKNSVSVQALCKWVLALVSRDGAAVVPMPAQVASVPPSVAPAVPAAAEAAAQPTSGSAAATAATTDVSEGMEDMIGTTLQRMAEQLDVLTVRAPCRVEHDRTIAYILSTCEHA